MMNFKRYFIFLVYIFHFIFMPLKAKNSDLAIVGPVKFADGIFRLSLIWIEQLKNDLKIDFVSTGYVDFDNVDPSLKDFICNSMIDNNVKKNPASVAVLLSSPWTVGILHAKHVPKSKIKIAYSMLEGTKIPNIWVKLFNQRFDAIVVPDKYLVDVYKSCGVKLPIFVLPIALFLDDFLNKPLKQGQNKIFRFGSSASFIPDKNHVNLLRAFKRTFGNNMKVELYLHGRGGDESKLLRLVKKFKLENVFVVKKIFNNEEYVNFLSSLDCYVLLSKGEGFSITPREAMALGIPCILSNNTAQKSICQTGLVESVRSEILERAFYVPFNAYIGEKFNCSIEDVCTALKNVYNNYSLFLKKADHLREWAKAYDYRILKYKYLTLVKPKKVILGKENLIGDGVLTTNCQNLYVKYLSINNEARV